MAPFELVLDLSFKFHLDISGSIVQVFTWLKDRLAHDSSVETAPEGQGHV